MLLIFLLPGFSAPVNAAINTRHKVENEHFQLRIISRTPDQIAAFYEARGFPKAAVDKLRSVCFIGIGLKNKGKEIVWFDLSNWHFLSENNAVKRYLRTDWKRIWNKMKLAKRFQSTFRWTLMPEQLDFRAYESEGGNIILPRIKSPMTIEATIVTGKEKSKTYQIRFEDVYCAEDIRS